MVNVKKYKELNVNSKSELVEKLKRGNTVSSLATEFLFHPVNITFMLFIIPSETFKIIYYKYYKILYFAKFN